MRDLRKLSRIVSSDSCFDNCYIDSHSVSTNIAFYLRTYPAGVPSLHVTFLSVRWCNFIINRSRDWGHCFARWTNCRGPSFNDSCCRSMLQSTRGTLRNAQKNIAVKTRNCRERQTQEGKYFCHLFSKHGVNQI